MEPYRMHSYFYRFSALCFLFGSLLFIPVSVAAEKSKTLDISGEWITDPELSQLGFLQASFRFNDDSTFMQKIDFLSFCGIKAITPDCEYFWMVTEGHYAVRDNILHLDIEMSYSQLLYQGLFRPEKREIKKESRSEDLPMEIKEGKLNITGKDNKLQIYNRAGLTGH